MKKCLPLVHSTSKLGKDVVEVSPSSLQLVWIRVSFYPDVSLPFSTLGIVRRFSSCMLGRDTSGPRLPSQACQGAHSIPTRCIAHFVLQVRHDGEPRFGIAPAAIEMRPPPPSPATVRVELDIGVRVLIPRARVEEPTALNSRAWIVCSPVMHAYTRESNCSPEGTYP
eukprot:1388657-Amorphochlora_amoeboformis.AAC.2